jgi:hypothetical protein
MPDLRIAALTAAAMLGSTMMVGTSAAMPLNGLPQANRQVAADVQNVRWVCGPRGCWNRLGWSGGPGWNRWGSRGPDWTARAGGVDAADGGARYAEKSLRAGPEISAERLKARPDRSQP